jgi:hypothetical protein
MDVLEISRGFHGWRAKLMPLTRAIRVIREIRG